MKEINLIAPFSKDDLANLRAGDCVRISGEILCARDAAHKRLATADKLPINLKGECIYYLGPSPAKPGRVIGSAGPTTAGRMDKYTPFMLDCGVVAMIGKGYRSDEVKKKIKECGAVYFATIGGAGALLSEAIKSYDIIAYEDLGPEAIARLKLENFLAYVAIDSLGNDFYEIGQKEFKKIS